MGSIDARWIYLPYCLQRLKDGRYIPLNRRYKPLGWQTRDWVDYDSHPSAARMKVTLPLARKLSWNGNEALDVIHLYSDSCVPTSSSVNMNAYLKKLAVFMKLMLESPG